MSEQQALDRLQQELQFFRVLSQYLYRYPAEGKRISNELPETLAFLLLRFFLHRAKTNWKDDAETFEYFQKVSEHEMNEFNNSDIQKQLFALSRQMGKMEVNDKVSYFIREELRLGNIDLLFRLIDGPPQIILKHYQPDSYIMTNARTKELTEVLQNFIGINFVIDPDLSIPQEKTRIAKREFFVEKTNSVEEVHIEDGLELELEQEVNDFNGIMLNVENEQPEPVLALDQNLTLNDDWFTEAGQQNPMLRSGPPKAKTLSSERPQVKLASKSHGNLEALEEAKEAESSGDEPLGIAKTQTFNDLSLITYAEGIAEEIEILEEKEDNEEGQVIASSSSSVSEEFYLPQMRTATIDEMSSNDSADDLSSEAALQSAHLAAKDETKKHAMLTIKEDVGKGNVVCELYEQTIFSNVEYCYDYFGKYQERLTYTRLEEKGWPERKMPLLEPFEKHILTLEPQHLTFPDAEKEVLVGCSKATQWSVNGQPANIGASKYQETACTTLESHNFVLIEQSYIGPLSRGVYCPQRFPIPQSLQREFSKQHALCHNCGERIEQAADSILAKQYCHFRGELVCENCTLTPTHLPTALIDGDARLYGVCAKCTPFIEEIFDKPFILSEALGPELRKMQSFRLAENLRRRVILAYKGLCKCDVCDTQISLFLEQEYSKYFKFAERHRGELLLSSACLLGDRRDHLGAFEQAVIAKSCKSGVDSVVSVGYWSCQDILDIHAEVLQTELESCIRQISDHIKSCIVCSETFGRTCACGVSVNVCSNGVRMCSKCGALLCQDCVKRIEGCYVCEYDE